ncbi:Hypothetical protein R9X50_00698200 [Acrodontium crateriforme]|uniref:Centromere protein S n=1 Tax=Acrodontium crateriforme TaxID=150365 RepID=A0AAQ3MDN3_9PEZI|nr:Hypothetical protein R9X50_00698200 [Acrodontium crateriforme]
MPAFQPAPSTAETLKEEQLKAALWHSIGQTVDAVSLASDLNAAPRFIGALSELCWAQIVTAAQDVEAFAKHAGRSTVRLEDVLLLARRNEGLEEVLKDEAERVQGSTAK